MKLKAPLAHCDVCPLKSRPFCGSHIPTDAVLTVIGEAPGVDEVIEGVPFVGQSGIVLRHALEFSGVDPARVAMTNAVLCRPLGTDDPPDDAIRACSARLDADIRRSGAQHIVAAGNVAARALDMLSGREVGSGIMSRAGKTYDYTRMVVNDVGAVYDTDTIDIKNQVFKYTCTTNPAYVLRQDPYTPTYLRHMQMAVNPRERNFDINAIKFVVMNESNKINVIQYINSFDRGAPMAFDVETGDLQWYDTPARAASPLLCFVLTFEDWRSVIIPADLIYNDIDVFDTVISALKKYHIIAHNGKFDQNVVAARLLEHFDIDDDTMLMHYALYELGGHGLKELANEYLGTPDYEDQLIVSWFRDNNMASSDKRDYAMLPKDRLYQYAAIDGAVTLQLWRIFDAELIAKNLYRWPYKNVLIETANALPTLEQTGIGIDRTQLARARAEFETALTEIEHAMTALVMPHIQHRIAEREHTQTTGTMRELVRLMTKRRKINDGEPNGKGGFKRGTAQYEEFLTYNPRSHDQTSAIIYDVFKLKLNKRLIKPTSANTGKEALEALPDHPFINELRQHRRIAKMLDTYIASIERRATIDDLIHVDFRITGTEIGRLSAASGDHGIPRPDDYYGAVIRSLFTADPNDEDEVLVICDYNQAELRAFAHLAQVAFLLEKYRSGADVHTETAIMLEVEGAPIFDGFKQMFDISTNTNVDPIDRKRAKAFVKPRRVLAKNINFGNIYQGGAEGISGMIGGAIPAKVIREVLNIYHTIMPEAAEYAERQFAFLQRHGYVKTIFNRQRRFYIISDMNRDEARKAAVHMVVAGSAADLTNLSTARLIKLGVRLCHSVHDSLIARAQRSEAETVANVMKMIMEDVGNEFMPSLPWIADIETLDDGSFPRRWVPTPKREDFDARGKLITS